MTVTIDGRPSTYEDIPPMLVPRPWRVVDKIDEGPGIVTLHVVPESGPVPSFQPAQCSMVGAFGVGEAAISISSCADESDFHAYTIRRAGAITNAVVDTPIGGIITVRGPFGTAWPIDQIDTSQVLVAAGGLGIVPLRAAVHELVGRRADFERLTVAYGARAPTELIFGSDREAWEAAGADVALTVDVGDADWMGAVGVVPSLLGSADGVNLEWADVSALVCGPDIMMRFTAATLVDLGVRPDRIWLTLERNMQCGNALCGHCQIGPFIVCRDGPVANYARIGSFLGVRDL